MSMTTAEKIAYVQSIVDDPEATDALVGALLTKAKFAVLNRRYPFGVPEDVTDVPDQYAINQCDLAVRYFLRKGGEGEQIHNENGIHRHYGSVNDEDILMEVMQEIRL